MEIWHTRVLATVLFVDLIGAPLAALGQSGAPAGNDPGPTLMNSVLTVSLKDYSISGLVTHLPEAKSFKYGIALFPGAPGIMKLREEAGEAKFTLGGNFLIRSRRHWLDDETLVISVDAPSDQWAGFSQVFRQEPRYGADVAALLTEASRRYRLADWTWVGTSEGTVSAFHAARMNPGLVQRLILTSSLFLAAGHGPGMSGVNWNEMKARLLWVHHADDGCRFTPYRSAQQHAEMTRSPLLTVHGGGPPRGAFCEPYSHHGFIGIERETVLAMRGWIKTGVPPADVVRE